MEEAAASKHEDHIQQLLAKLEARFKGRRCYLGQYVSPKPFLSGEHPILPCMRIIIFATCGCGIETA